MAKQRATRNSGDQWLGAAIDEIKRALGIETLETRGRDALDFHDVSVSQLRRAIRIAFDAGYEAGFSDGELLKG